MNLLAEASDPAISSIPAILASLVPLLPASRPGADVLSVLAAEAGPEDFSTSHAIGEQLRAETAIPTRYHASKFPIRIPSAASSKTKNESRSEQYRSTACNGTVLTLGELA